MKKNKKKSCINACGEFHGSALIGERGQVVIPKKLRDSLQLKKGDNFFVMQKDGAIILLPADTMESFIQGISGKIKSLKK